MNDTLKGVAHIGAELAAAKADLQREMERHRKTWRQLEQVTGLLRRWMSDEARDNPHAIYVASEAALSQQAEPECRCTMRERTLGDGCSVCNPEYAADHEAEPAPAQDERTAFEAWVMQHNTAVREDYDDTDENAPEDIRLDRQGGVYIWANAEAAWFAWKARSALDTRPAQTEQKPVAWLPYLSDGADGVTGHYAIARNNPAGYREVWNLRRHHWAAFSDGVLTLDEALAILKKLEMPTAPIAQTAPVPSAARQILDLIMEECRYWHGRDEARRGNFANLYAAAKELADNTAPISQTATLPSYESLIQNAKALLSLDERGSLVPHGIGGLAREVIEKLVAQVEQTAPQPEQSGLVEAALRKAVAYLDENPFNEIASGSILHRVMGAALSTQGGDA